jgi:hypothetical protein
MTSAQLEQARKRLAEGRGDVKRLVPWSGKYIPDPLLEEFPLSRSTPCGSSEGGRGTDG